MLQYYSFIVLRGARSRSPQERISDTNAYRLATGHQSHPRRHRVLDSSTPLGETSIPIPSSLSLSAAAYPCRYPFVAAADTAVLRDAWRFKRRSFSARDALSLEHRSTPRQPCLPALHWSPSSRPTSISSHDLALTDAPVEPSRRRALLPSNQLLPLKRT